MKKRILVICYDWPNNFGGYNKSILSCIEQYEKYFDLDILVFSERKQNFEQDKIANYIHFQIKKKKYILSSVNAIINQRPIVEQRYYRAWKDNLHLINFKKYSVVIAQGVLLGRLIQDIPPIRHQAKVLMSHDCFQEAYHDIWMSKKLFMKPAWMFEEYLIKRHERKVGALFDKSYAITENDKLSYEKHKIHCDGVFHRFPELNIGSNVSTVRKTKKLITVGRVDDRKSSGLKAFIKEVFKPLRLDIPEIEYHLIGKGTEAFDCPREGVYGHGFVETNDILQKSGAIFVNPQFQVSGLQFKLMSALESRMIILSNEKSVAGLKSSLREYLVKYEDFDDAKSKLRLLLNGGSLSFEMMERLQKLNIEKFYDQEMYQNNRIILESWL